MKLLLVSQRVDKIKSRNEIRDSVDQKLLEFIKSSGYSFIQVPNIFFNDPSSKQEGKRDLNLWISNISPDGVVLSGGNDLNSFPQRDSTEYNLLKYAKKNDLPTLGICRGMQLMASLEGIKLVKIDGHINKRHFIRGEINMEVNSFHNQALSQCPDDYYVIAKSLDNIIKAIKHKSLPWEGWMWHPERETPFKNLDKLRFKDLFK